MHLVVQVLDSEKSAACGCSTFPTAKPRIMPHVCMCVCAMIFPKRIPAHLCSCVRSSPGQWALNWLKLSQVCEAIKHSLLSAGTSIYFIFPVRLSLIHPRIYFFFIIMDVYEMYYPYMFQPAWSSFFWRNNARGARVLRRVLK